MKNRLKDILKIQSHSRKQWRMFNFLIRECKKQEYNYYVNNGNIYITKGNSRTYQCMVAHMDTVHPICENLSILECGDNLTGFNTARMTQTGIGGDDKVGIFMALECLRKFDNFKVAFFRDEEIGCVGSYEADIEFFSNCNIILQGDRQGNGDFVNNISGVSLSSSKFQNDITGILKNYGYSFSDGGMTDVLALKELGVKASMANISCGYYNPHRNNEYVNTTDVLNCLDMVFDIFTTLGDKDYTHKFVSNYKPYTSQHNWSSADIPFSYKKNEWDSYLDELDEYDLMEKYLMDYYGVINKEDLLEILAIEGFSRIQDAYYDIF